MKSFDECYDILFRVINDFSFIQAHGHSFDSQLFLLIDSLILLHTALFP